MVQTLLIDNYDSFTYNLAALLTEVNGRPPVVVTNDAAWGSLDLGAVDNIVISPGPGDPTVPADFGISARAIADSGLPVLGVCLGHQGLCAEFGARVVRAPQPVHGRVSRIRHTGRDLFEGLPSPMSVVRYHSLIAVDLPEELEVLARTDEGLVMAVRHRRRPLWGVQFHPESIASDHGAAIMRNFRALGNPVRRPKGVAAPRQTNPVSGRRQAGYAVNHRRIPHLPDAPSLYRRLFAGRPGAFWLDGRAAEPGERFTIMGDATGPLAEYLTYDVDARQVHVDSARGHQTQSVTSLFDYLEVQLTSRAIPPDAALPCPFRLGYVGYLGYELKAESGGGRRHRSPHPDGALVFADRAVVIDHDRGCSYLLALRLAGDTPPHWWLDQTAAVLRSVAADDVSTAAPAVSSAPLDISVDAGVHRARVEECLDLIGQGQTYEVCLTTTARIDRDIDAVATFERACVTNPAPYAALLQFAGLSVVSASPERFLRVGDNRVAESKPIKGTRPRGSTPEADLLLRNTLHGSEKDRAENLMIVDLVRNDLTRVCVPESVHVPSLFGVESYPFVHQLVSTVRGTLREDVHPVDAVRALFPAGSMTGAPKVRTMDILDRLEGRARGVYSGALGYLSLSGAIDLSVVIRTVVAAGGSIEIGIGGAITALSDPAEEYAEILLKAASWRNTLAAPAPVGVRAGVSVDN